MGATPLRALIGWVLVALMLVSSGCDRLSRQAGPGAQGPSQPLAPTAPRGALQEVAPPPLVPQLKARLDRRDPQVSILAPADGALLPAGPWWPGRGCRHGLLGGAGVASHGTAT